MGFRILYIALIFFIPISCNQETVEDCISRKGPQATINRLMPEDFTEIEVGDRFDITLIQDSAKANTLELSGPADVLSGIATEVVNGRLNIRDENYCKWIRQLGMRIPITIYFEKLDYLLVKETASIKNIGELKSNKIVIDQLSTQKIQLKMNVGTCDINHRSQGEINLTGYIAVFIPVIFDSGLLDARNMVGDYIFVYHYGLNEVKVTPYKRLLCYLENKGNVFYYADPIMPLETQGTGKGRAIRGY